MTWTKPCKSDEETDEVPVEEPVELTIVGVIPPSARCARFGCVIVELMSGLILELGLESELPLPSGPQMTRRIGKSFAQLLTNKAVLMAVGVA